MALFYCLKRQSDPILADSKGLKNKVIMCWGQCACTGSIIKIMTVYLYTPYVGTTASLGVTGTSEPHSFRFLEPCEVDVCIES